MTVTPEMDRRNGLILMATYLLIYLSAPVIYVGVVQAALVDKLGARAMIANLPSAAFQFAQFAPLLLAWLVPHRLEKPVVVWANLLTAFLMTVVCVALVLPLPAWFRIGSVVMHGLFQGLTGSASQIFTIQCLRRGTTEQGLARALRLTYTVGPIAAVAGSLGAQYILRHGIRGVSFPFDFALLYCVGIPSLLGVAWLSNLYQIIDVPDEPRQPLFRYLRATVRDYAAIPALVLLWFAYAAWNAALTGTPNLSLYTREALGRDPKDFSGIVNAIRFGTKAVAGWFLGLLALRKGLRASVLATLAIFAVGIAWPLFAPGYSYLACFGFMGAGELGGTYFPNYAALLSSPADAPRFVSLLTLAAPVASFAPVLYGAVSDHFGFRASFVLGSLVAIVGLVLVARIRKPAA